MAVMSFRLGGCLGETIKLWPLASTDLWAWVKGLLDRLITHLGLGSFGELSLGEPWGSLTLAACLLAWGTWGLTALSPWELVLTAWGEALTAWELVFSARGEAALSPWEVMLTAWEDALIVWKSALSAWGLPVLTALSPWEIVLVAWGEVLTAWESAFSAWKLPACGWTELSPWEMVLTDWGEVLAVGHQCSLPRNYLPEGKQC